MALLPGVRGLFGRAHNAALGLDGGRGDGRLDQRVALLLGVRGLGGPGRFAPGPPLAGRGLLLRGLGRGAAAAIVQKDVHPLGKAGQPEGDQQQHVAAHHQGLHPAGQKAVPQQHIKSAAQNAGEQKTDGQRPQGITLQTRSLPFCMARGGRVGMQARTENLKKAVVR